MLELQSKGQQATYEDVLANIVNRAHIDTTRKERPLRCASDAIRIDNSEMTPDEQDALVLKLFNDATA